MTVTRPSLIQATFAVAGHESSDPVFTRPEYRISASLLVCVVVLQCLSSIKNAVLSSRGRCGRCLYITAMFIATFHDAFVGLAVPIILLWLAAELYNAKQNADALLIAAVGVLWYGPDRVEGAITNLIAIRTRWRLLLAALAPYHRTNGRERLSFWPSIHSTSSSIPHATSTNNDKYLRSIARIAVEMSFNGGFSEMELRHWCMLTVADQARFAGSPLDRVSPSLIPIEKHNGFGALRMKASVLKVKESWSADE